MNRDARLLARVTRVGLATVAAAASVAALVTLTRVFQADAYRYLPSISPTVICVCVGALLSTLAVAVPPYESLEVSAARRLYSLRTALVVFLVLLVLGLSIAGGVALEDGWFVSRLMRIGLTMSALTLFLAQTLPRPVAGVLGVGYVVGCYQGSEGTRPWDLVFRELSDLEQFGLTVVVLMAFGTFVFRVASIGPEEESVP